MSVTVAARAPMTVEKTRNCETGALVKPEDIMLSVARDVSQYHGAVGVYSGCADAEKRARRRCHSERGGKSRARSHRTRHCNHILSLMVKCCISSAFKAKGRDNNATKHPAVSFRRHLYQLAWNQRHVKLPSQSKIHRP